MRDEGRDGLDREIEKMREAQRRNERDEHLKSALIERAEPVNQCATSPASPSVSERAQGAAGLTLENVEDAFTYHRWDGWQKEAGDIVRETLTAAAKAMLRVVPAGPSRTRALNCLTDARMLANQSITFRGRF